MYAINRSNQTGQTLLELLVGLTLITLFLSGIVVIQLTAIRNAQSARTKSLGSRLAQEQLERARVIRDSAGISGLSTCLLSCYINNQLTPEPLAPTGIFRQTLTMQLATTQDCISADVTPQPGTTFYKLTSNVQWNQGISTPGTSTVVSSCLSN